MEQKISKIISFITAFLFIAFRAVTVHRFDHGVLYLVLTYTFLLAYGVFLGFYCFSNLFTKKWIKLLDVFLFSALLISFFADFYCLHGHMK